tara:strand:- start:363 stop:1289 length:927 start_codon:yes stop_codon:yes gene_type:complete
MIKVSITGADGFLGSYLSDFLEKRNIEVNKLTRTLGYDLRLLNQNFKNNKWLKALNKSDFIVHCASKVHDFNQSSFEEFRQINVEGSCALLNLAIRMKVKKFIYISSIKVLGENSTFKQPFNSKSIPNPIGNYSFSKFQAEEKLKKIASENNIDLIIIRPPLIYGPNVGANFLTIMNLVYRRIPLPFKGIKNKRSIVFVGNISDLIYNCLINSNVRNCSLLISDDELVSSIELMKLISTNFGYKLRLFKFPLFLLSIIFYLVNKKSQFDRIKSSLVVDSSYTKRLLNWKQPYTLQEGLKITTNAYTKK